MKTAAVNLVRALYPRRVAALSPWPALLCATLTALLLAACVTQVPRTSPAAPPTATAATTPAATPAITPTAVPLPTAAPLPTSAPLPTPASSPAPQPTRVNTPVPTLIATPTAAPAPTRAVATPTAAPTATTAATPPPPAPTEDPSGLMLLIYAPEDGSTVSGSSVVVYGQTVPGARVFVSGNETGVDAEGGFRVSVPLDPAENEVLIMARNDAGDQRRVTRRVTSLALPFLLLVTEPANESVVSTPSLPLSGRTGPSAIVSINGRSVPVDRFGYFSGSVQLDEGPNVIDVVATNDDGQTLSTVLAVIYRSPS